MNKTDSDVIGVGQYKNELGKRVRSRELARLNSIDLQWAVGKPRFLPAEGPRSGPRGCEQHLLVPVT
ncbi:hypothetical protein RUM43_010041 [Polyplax serrata]|uniref:Uncharacterized protein n=1 Tax=Polyplax serrata TaxID=468196 RepID=A0AAN8PK17_POLSC